MRHYRYIFMLTLSFALLGSALFPLMSAAQSTADRCFPETGYCISGRFRVYWEANGGLPVFGYPISGASYERNPATGDMRLTQWFERVRFELHPENAPPYDVLLGRLGVDLLQQYGSNWWTLPPGQAREGCLYFEATRHALCEPFLSTWHVYGLELDGVPGKSYEESLALFGAPISEPRWELHGGTQASVRLTQWFERARFEWHSELAQVLMGHLGAELYATRAPVVAATPAPVAQQPTATPVVAGAPEPVLPTSTSMPTSAAPGTDAPGDTGELPTTTPTVTSTSVTTSTPSPTMTITPSPSPTLPPRSYRNCQDDPNKASAANFPIRIVTVDKADQEVRLQNVSAETIDITGWTMCSITGADIHRGIEGELEPNETRTFPYTGSGQIWDEDIVDNGALYNINGQLVSYWFDPS